MATWTHRARASMTAVDSDGYLLGLAATHTDSSPIGFTAKPSLIGFLHRQCSRQIARGTAYNLLAIAHCQCDPMPVALADNSDDPCTVAACHCRKLWQTRLAPAVRRRCVHDAPRVIHNAALPFGMLPAAIDPQLESTVRGKKVEGLRGMGARAHRVPASMIVVDSDGYLLGLAAPHAD